MAHMYDVSNGRAFGNRLFRMLLGAKYLFLARSSFLDLKFRQVATPNAVCGSSILFIQP